MTARDDKDANAIPRWAAPWAPGWSGMRDPNYALPKNVERSIRRIGVAATSVAATIWLLAIVWVWQIIG